VIMFLGSDERLYRGYTIISLINDLT